MNRVEAALRGIASDLTVLHSRWALVGGFAVSVRTERHFTRDVDVAVLVDAIPLPSGWSDRSSIRECEGPEFERLLREVQLVG